MNTSPSPGPHGSQEGTPQFTPLAQQALVHAREESARLNHNFVGTEHLLLGLIKLGQGVAITVLRKLGLNLENVRQEVENQVGRGPDENRAERIPYTPRVKKVLALAAKEAKSLGHTYVGTEHILLGLMREGDGVAARVLTELKVDVQATREAILQELDPNYKPPTEASQAASVTPILHLSSQSATFAGLEPGKSQFGSVDTTRRYDVYCVEWGREIVVYRNALFKSARGLFARGPSDRLSDFLELEQANGQTIFIRRTAVIRFCEPGVTPNPEPVVPANPQSE
jgi:Clp amino terminal domain, pathogenicity island component